VKRAMGRVSLERRVVFKAEVAEVTEKSKKVQIVRGYDTHLK